MSIASPTKKKVALALVLVLLVVIPGLASVVVASVAAVAVWVSTQQILLGVVLGAVVVPRLRRSRPRRAGVSA